MSEASAEEPQGQAEVPAISEIAVSGFKSIRDECRIAVRPLTILAGANSSGKSSIMQPLLLMKQTVHATYDAGALLLAEGPNYDAPGVTELLWRTAGGTNARRFAVGVEIGGGYALRLTYGAGEEGEIALLSESLNVGGKLTDLRPGMTAGEVLTALSNGSFRAVLDALKFERSQFRVERHGLLLEIRWGEVHAGGTIPGRFAPAVPVAVAVASALHVPGVRWRPGRLYLTAATESGFPGVFDRYVASLVLKWLEDADPASRRLEHWLSQLGLTSRVTPNRLDATHIELRVARAASSGETDLVNIADVGFGVSQVLPVLVALLAAEPGQLVYIEQPELHLHPKAQIALAGILVEAAKRGIRAIIETHSDLLLLGLQTAIARGDLDSDKAVLHWFERDAEGVTRVTSAHFDELGALDESPMDFGVVSLRAHDEFLDAAEAREAALGDA